MAQLFSQYESGTSFSAGTIAGSILGASGLNPIVDRLNSITSDNSVVSGTTVNFIGSNIEAMRVSGTSFFSVGSTVHTKIISGTDLLIYSSGGDVGGAQTTLYAGSGMEILNGSVVSMKEANAINKSGTDLTFVGSGINSAGFLSGTNTEFYGKGLLSGTTAEIYTKGNLSGTSAKFYGGGQILGATSTVDVGSINQTDGMFIMENRTSDPASPPTGRMWIRTDL